MKERVSAIAKETSKSYDIRKDHYGSDMTQIYEHSQKRELKNYHINSNLYKLYKNNNITDVHFIFTDEKKQIAANKCLLAVASPVFEKMFYGELKEPGDITIVDATHDAFLEFLQFFYCDKFELTTDHISEVLTLADKYDVAGLINLCVQFLEYYLTDQTVCWVYDLALMFDLVHLINLCQEKISLETVTVFTSESFRACGANILSRILEMDELSCDEIFVFHQVMEWATEACRRSMIEPTMENKKLELGQCFDLIRFPTMSSEQFSVCIAEDGLLDGSELIDILGYLTLRRTLKTKRFSTQPRCGIPAWTKDKTIVNCDRRSLPNLCKLVTRCRDVTNFSVNERILLGQLGFSTFKSESVDHKHGQLVIKRSSCRELPLHSQTIEISTSSFTKIMLQKPIILQPFEQYEIETKWELDDGESLLFRTDCRSEVMLDGGVRFQFQPDENLDYDNVSEGLVYGLYFKKW
ncbi:BTB/POZ domain-containing protein 6-A-like isoform X1 [Bradysia coprophila]|uniref:BTB/POZ domain-containing protein 6-A-like isoform X1 n=2 Tax=Bradysia coprophila TaxID=38358 RepID=UPI00187DB00A|nr:BTB/POZ domain-containing protein 6-A-like isoform X1 [Bradysia coprophila]